ncbi:hypothetical protein C8J56DRAFT_971983 [Mycena floridula]|nr:hypothetical protein C8J56DRAFT_971983 [Mycena floridula]
MAPPTLRMFFPILTLFCSITYAHDHGHEMVNSSAPVDSVLWIHIALQMLVWALVFPVGMVLGMTRSRWHVPVQVSGYVLTTAGYILGHAHGGRTFPESAHEHFATILMLSALPAQLVLGIYLKLHIHENSLRPWAVRLHGVIGKAFPIIAWVQMLFGAIVFRGYCRGDDLGQCLAHYIMGGGFIAYGCIMAILLLAGQTWVRKSGKSPEWWDSWVIMLWGIVNTFTQHRGSTWSVKDMQHTILGVLWWAGGLLGIFLARNNQRNVIPGLIIILTGWAMSNHMQALQLSTMVHSMFGYALMLAGLARIIEVCLWPTTPALATVPPAVERASEDQESISDRTVGDGPPIRNSQKHLGLNAFRHLPPFLLVASGLLFMSATDEELRAVKGIDMDHVTYILIMFSLAFLLYCLMVYLIHVFLTTGRNAPGASSQRNLDHIEMTAQTKWYAPVPNSDQHVIGDDED